MAQIPFFHSYASEFHQTVNDGLTIRSEDLQISHRQKVHQVTYDELFEACGGLFHRVGVEDLTLHGCLLSQETKH